MQQKTVVIVAQSGRFLAQLAAEAGYSVRVADCFGDQDTLSIAERWIALSTLHDHDAIYDAILELSQNQPCFLIYGSGVEVFFPVLTRLPKTITLIGNAADVIEQLKNPLYFFSLLQQLSITYPETYFSRPEVKHARWICKPEYGFGGQLIHDANEQTESALFYYQRYIEGLNGSVLFLADGHSVQICRFNQQFQCTESERPFLLSGLSSSVAFSLKVQATVTQFIQRIVTKTALKGFNSLDFIATGDDEVLVLEINPRLSASAELIDTAEPLFQIHLAACLNKTLSEFEVSTRQRHLHTIFAPADLVIPDSIHWPTLCYDIPKSHTVIEQDAPICTVIVDASSPFMQSKSEVQSAIFTLLGL